MTERQKHALRRLLEARVAYERDPGPTNQHALERAETRYAAAMTFTKVDYDGRMRL